MQKLTFLGYGNAFAKMSKNTSAFLIFDDIFLLFDCGENIFEILEQKKPFLSCKKIIILLTHFHSDHTGSVGSFVFSLRNQGSIPTGHMKNLAVSKQAKLHPTERTTATRKCLILSFEAYLSQQKLSWFYLFS